MTVWPATSPNTAMAPVQSTFNKCHKARRRLRVVAHRWHEDCALSLDIPSELDQYLVPPAGFEPAAFCSGGSYEPFAVVW